MTGCSVALCTYNGARHLAAQLDSIAAQSRLPDELVACDDASTDDSPEILRRFAARAPFPVRVIRNDTNVGVARNFETAIRRCHGDWIALSDQDDVWHRSKLELLESALMGAASVGAVFTDADVVDESLRPLGYSLWDAIAFDRRRRSAARQGHLLDVLLWRNVVTGATMAFRSQYRDLVLPIPDIWMHDAWIALIMAAHVRVVPLPERTIKYRQHMNNRVGAERLSVSSRVRRFLTTGPASNRLQHRLLEAAREHLARPGGPPLSPSVLPRLARKLAHLEARDRMPGPRWRRLPLVAGELIAGNYGRYSSGWVSALADLAVSTAYRGATASLSV